MQAEEVSISGVSQYPAGHWKNGNNGENEGKWGKMGENGGEMGGNGGKWGKMGSCYKHIMENV